jgi:hypothetical protein
MSLFLLCAVEIQRSITAGGEPQAILPGIQEKVTYDITSGKFLG